MNFEMTPLMRKAQLDIWVDSIFVITDKHSFPITGSFPVEGISHCVKNGGLARTSWPNHEIKALFAEFIKVNLNVSWVSSDSTKS
jgi:hypothetical protein